MSTTSPRYRSDPDAIRALVQPDRVHRDVYLSQEIFELEQEHLFRNTWNYVGHESQLPNEGDYLTTELAGRPLVLLRQADNSIKTLMNRCPHKGARVVSGESGNIGRFFRCPYHAWTFKPSGELLAIPFKGGYEATSLLKTEARHGLIEVKATKVYKGFIFVRLSDKGPSFEDFFGYALSSLDNLVARSPEGALELSGGCVRFLHRCNWKMIVENLNDTCHPMVAHESSAGAAKRLWQGVPEEEPKPMAIEQFIPLASDYTFFANMGMRALPNGHGWSGENYSIHSKYSAIPEYEEALCAAQGEDKAREVLGLIRHNTVYYPSLTIKGALQTIRVFKPINANLTVVESWCFRLKGAPDSVLERSVNWNTIINSPFSIVGHDDLHVYKAMHNGLRADGNEWISLHRDFDPAELEQQDLTTTGTSEIPMRNQFRAWSKYMTMSMIEVEDERV